MRAMSCGLRQAEDLTCSSISEGAHGDRAGGRRRACVQCKLSRRVESPLAAEKEGHT